MLVKLIKVILIAHNGHKFDAPILINNMVQAGFDYDDLSEQIHGFVDTLVCFRHHFPEYTYSGGQTLEAWRKRFNLDGVQHEALKDTEDLKTIVRIGRKRKNMSFEDFIKVGFKSFKQISLR